MRRWIVWIICLCLLAGGTALCTIRWKAWFANPYEPEWTEPEIAYQFVTFDNDSVLHALQRDTLSFILLGDVHNSLSNSDLLLLTERYNDVHFWAQLGDFMERPYQYYEQQMYLSLIGTRLETLPIVAIPGNHEYLKGIVKTLPSQWKTIFPNPANGPQRFLGTSYFVDFPHMRLIAIDTDGLQRISDYTQVAFWLKKVLREAHDRFAVVMMHHPIYSTADGRCNPMLWMNFHSAMREADVVFSGHDHNYTRRTVQYKARFWKKEQPTVFIATNASDKVYPIKQYYNYDARFTGEAVCEYITVTADTLSISTYLIHSGEQIDNVIITH